MKSSEGSARECVHGALHPVNRRAVINSSKDHKVLGSRALVGMVFHSMVLVGMVLDMDRNRDLCRSSILPIQML